MSTYKIPIFHSIEFKALSWDETLDDEENFKNAGFYELANHIEPAYYLNATPWWELREYWHETDGSIFVLEDGKFTLFEFYCAFDKDRLACLSKLMNLLLDRLRVEKILKEFADNAKVYA